LLLQALLGITVRRRGATHTQQKYFLYFYRRETNTITAAIAVRRVGAMNCRQ